MPCESSAAVILPVCAGSRPLESSVYDGAVASLSMKKRIAMIATEETARLALVRAGSASRFLTNEGMAQLHLGLEERLGRFDGLVTDLARELHRQLGALNGHHDRGRVGRRAGGEVGRRLRGLVLGRLQRLQRLADHGAEVAA